MVRHGWMTEHRMTQGF